MLLAFVAVCTIVTLVFLALEVMRKLNLLDTASSDNVQWTLSQTEVEFLEFLQDLTLSTNTDTPDVSRVRREFDIFYSRINTVSESALYGPLRAEPGYAETLSAVRRFLDDAALIIDGPEPEFVARLPELLDMAESMRLNVRKLAVTGLDYFAELEDQRRESVAGTLLRLALATLALVSIVVVAALNQFRMYRLSERRTNDLSVTSARLHTVFSTSLDAILVADGDGKILEFNAAAETIFGYRRDEVLGRDLGDVIVPDKFRAAHAAGMKRHRETGEKRIIGAGRVRLEGLRADGSIFPVEMSVQTAKGAKGGEIFVSFIRDISHRLKAEKDLITARDQALAGEKAKTEFLAIMSHEIRTPLNGLLGTLSLLKDLDLTPKLRSYVDNMEASGALLRHHVNDVLDVTKYEAGKLSLNPVPVNLSELVQSVIDNQRDLAAAHDNEISWQWCGQALPTVITDPTRLRQVLINLVSNAVKHTESGSINVELEAGKPANGHAPLDIRVIDTGIGIDPEPDRAPVP